MKWSFCHPRLAIAFGLFEASDGDALERDGITHVIHCRTEPDLPLVTCGRLAVLWAPADDDGRPKPPEWFGRGIEFALHALAAPWHRVCVHCYAGNNRSPSLALAILLAQGFAFDAAQALVREARPGAPVRYGEDARAAVKILGYN